MIDGTIARKTNSNNEYGARLDTVADFIFITVSLIKFLPTLHIQIWLWIWISVIAILKFYNIIFVYVSGKQFIVLHTAMNKITGLLLFLLPLTLSFVEFKYSSIALCLIATISAIQETLIVNKKH